MVCESPPQIPFTPLNETDLRLSSTPLVMLCQAAPPSVVRRIVPLSPTATPSFGSRKEMPCNVVLVPDVSGVQVAPASVLFRIVPVSPTTKPVPESRRIAPFKLLVVPESTGDHCPKTLRLEKSAKKNVTAITLKLDIGSLQIVLSKLLRPLRRVAAHYC